MSEADKAGPVSVGPKAYSTAELAKCFEADPRLKQTYIEIAAEYRRQLSARENLLAGVTLQEGGVYELAADWMAKARGEVMLDVDGDDKGNIKFRCALKTEGKPDPKTLDVEAKDVTNDGA